MHSRQGRRILVTQARAGKGGMESELRQVVEDRFRAIVDRRLTMVAVMTSNGGLERANQQMLDYLGKTPEVMRLQKMCDNFHPDDRPQVVARWGESVATGRDISPRESLESGPRVRWIVRP